MAENEDQGELVTLDEKTEQKLETTDQKVEARQAALDEKTDERVGHDAGTVETDDEKRERNRAERREKKRRRQEFRERDALEMRFLRQRNEDLERQLNQTTSRVVANEAVVIDGRIETLRAQINQANDVMGKASAAGDGASYTEALQIKDQLNDRLQRLEREKANRVAEAQQTQQRAQQPSVDPVMREQASIFFSENPWYDPAGRDEDSLVAKAVDQALVQSGFDPRTEKYWTELRSRLKKRLPHRFAQGESLDGPDDDDDNLDDEPTRSSGNLPQGSQQQRTATRREGPTFPSGGAARNPKPGQVYVSAERKAAMIEAGVWDDPKLRDRVLRRYQKFDQDTASRNSK